MIVNVFIVWDIKSKLKLNLSQTITITCDITIPIEIGNYYN